MTQKFVASYSPGLAALAARRIELAANAMSLTEAIEIITLAEEPDLLINAGDEPPAIPAELHKAARLTCYWSLMSRALN